MKIFLVIAVLGIVYTIKPKFIKPLDEFVINLLRELHAI